VPAFAVEVTGDDVAVVLAVNEPESRRHLLKVTGLRAAAGGKEIIHGVDFEVHGGEVHVVMGPNGSGKSTLAHALMGRPARR